jgi:hypothetical protein
MPDLDEREARNPFSGPRADLGRRAEATDTIIIGVAVVAGLYFGREVLVPMSIAILLSFVLAPVTDVLSRLRIGRVASALIAVALAFAILGMLGAIIGRQAAQLSENLPAYQVEISKKLDAVRSSAFGARMVEKAADALHGLENNIGKNAVPAPPQSAQGQTTQAPDHPLVQVEVHEPPAGPVQTYKAFSPPFYLRSPRLRSSSSSWFSSFSNDAICATDLSVSLARMICTAPRRPLMTPRNGSAGTSWR